MKRSARLLPVASGILLAGIMVTHAAPADEAPVTQRPRSIFRWRQHAEQPCKTQKEEPQPSIQERMMQRKPDVDGHEMRRKPLSEDEKQEIIEATGTLKTEAQLDEFFERYDKNNDGCISREELRAYIEERKPQKQ